MRLKEFEITAIKEVVHELDAGAQIYLFGSRADDSKRGGDIDLLIMSEKLTADDKYKIRSKLYQLIGEQKIDILIAKDRTDPFVRIALKEGVLM